MTKLKKLNEQEMAKSLSRFNKLLEYSYVNKEEDLLLDEDDDMPEEMPQPGVDNQQPENGNMSQPGMDGQQPQPGNPGETPANAPNINTEPNQQPIPQDGQDMFGDDNEIETNGDEVELDVTDLTNKQDDVDAKVSDMTSQTQQMMDMLTKLSDKVENIIQKTSAEINNIKDEIVKRNPTPVEVLQKRITVSDPFSETPKQYWDKKQSQGHYKLSDNENEENLEIKGSDLDNNYSDIYKSFGIDDDEFNQSLATMFRL